MPDSSPVPDLRCFALAALAARFIYSNPPPHNSGSSPDGSRSDTLEESYLRGQLARAGSISAQWRQGLGRYILAPEPQDLPLLELAGRLKLSESEVLAVALCATIEDDLVAGRCVAYLQTPLGGSRPTLGLLAQAFSTTSDSARGMLHHLSAGPAVRCGLLEVGLPQAPLPERPLRLPVHLGQALSGEDGYLAGAQIGEYAANSVPLPSSILVEARRQARGLRLPGISGGSALVIRSGSPAEARAAAAILAGELDRRPVYLDSSAADHGDFAGLAPWLLLRGLLPVFSFELAPGERRHLPSLLYYDGPILALCGPEGSVELAGSNVPDWRLGPPGCDERLRLWQQAIGPGFVAELMAEEHRHGAGRIAHLGRLARRQAALEGRSQANEHDVAAAAWVSEAGALDALAQPLPEPVPDEALVRPAQLKAALDLLLERCRRRDRLVKGLGVAAIARYHPGVRALFVGASGTGKTLAAGWLATCLGLPLYRVDLASVTSKYIGETEKNLAQLLARAEQAEVVLLFDEADSMFGKRTDVKDSNDRFANAQTNYLLQRIETYDGITLLTSNSRSRFDAAFTRRLDSIIEFDMPGPEQRRELWLAHLGQSHTLTNQELNRLAAAANVSGGDIRNAVLSAAVLAGKIGRGIAYVDVLEGLAVEYKKLSRQMPVELG
jgi:hypothetical protein